MNNGRSENLSPNPVRALFSGCSWFATAAAVVLVGCYGGYDVDEDLQNEVVLMDPDDESVESEEDVANEAFGVEVEEYIPETSDLDPDEVEHRTGVFAGPDGVLRAEYMAHDGLAIVEGDMLFDLEEVMDPEEYDSLSSSERSFFVTRWRWPGGVVPYVIGRVRYPEHVREAISHWNRKTHLRLVPRTNQRGYMYFRPVRSGCSAKVGYRSRRRDVKLEPGCGVTAIIHEIGHVVGLLHEHTSSKRDYNVIILWSNIQRSKKHNFYRRSGHSPLNYDYESVMHYHSHAFSRNGQPTIVPIRRGAVLGNRTGLSYRDIRGLQYMYPR